MAQGLTSNTLSKANLAITGTLSVDNINENTASHGIVADSVTLKDGAVTQSAGAVLATDHISEVTASHGIVTNTDIFSVDWTDYAASSTVTGWSSFDSKHIWYKKLGKLVFVSFHIEGTSNTAGASFTVPYTSAAGTDITYGAMMMSVYNAGVRINAAVPCKLTQNSATVNCYTDNSGGGWTNQDLKLVEGNFWYQTA